MANFTEEDIHRALERIYRAMRTVEEGAPVELIALNNDAVMESRLLLGEDKWAEVENRFKTYKYFLRAREKESDAKLAEALSKVDG